MAVIERRKFITGLVSLIAAPAIVRAGSLMPVKALRVQSWADYEALKSTTYYFSSSEFMAINFTGKMIVDLIPKVYDVARVISIK